MAADPPRLEPLAEGFAETRRALHRVAEHIVAPARKPASEIALRCTPGGFGTPVFEFEGVACQVRVDGPELVVRRGSEERSAPISTLMAAAELVGEDLLGERVPDESEPLGVDPTAAAQVGRWYGFARAVFADLRRDWDGDGVMDPSLVQLWPEHFDLALEAGPAADGRRANYGASPGDDAHAEPYLYVGPWTATVEGDLWRATGFKGAELGYAELVDAEDQFGAALRFFRARSDALNELEVSR